MLVWSNRRIVLPHPIVTDGTVWSNLDAFAVRLSMKPLASVDPSVGPVAHAVTMIPALGPVSGVFAAVLEDVLSFTAPQPVLELPFVLGAIGPGVLSLALPLIHAKVAGIDWDSEVYCSAEQDDMALHGTIAIASSYMHIHIVNEIADDEGGFHEKRSMIS